MGELTGFDDGALWHDSAAALETLNGGSAVGASPEAMERVARWAPRLLALLLAKRSLPKGWREAIEHDLSLWRRTGAELPHRDQDEQRNHKLNWSYRGEHALREGP
jgi:hypothetical protein